MSAVADTINSRDQILDAAEELWSTDSYEAVSIRKIMARADLDFSLCRYYFGNKESLLWHVVSRRAGIYCQTIHASLDAAIAAVPGTPPSVEAWITAMIEPGFNRLSGPDIGWRNYIRLLANFLVDRQDRKYLTALHTNYEPVMRRFVQGFDLICPGNGTHGVWVVYFMHAAAISIHRNPRILDHLMPGGVGTGDYGVILTQMVAQFSAAFRSRVGTPA